MGREATDFTQRVHVDKLDEQVEDILTKVRRIDACRSHAHLQGAKFLQMNFKAAPRASKELRIFLGNLEKAIKDSPAPREEVPTARQEDSSPGSPNVDVENRRARLVFGLVLAAVLLPISASLATYSVMNRRIRTLSVGHEAAVKDLRAVHAGEISRITQSHDERIEVLKPIMTPETDQLVGQLDSDDPIAIAVAKQERRLARTRDELLANKVKRLLAERSRQDVQEGNPTQQEGGQE